jgi:hypothetical protein
MSLAVSNLPPWTALLATFFAVLIISKVIAVTKTSQYNDAATIAKAAIFFLVVLALIVGAIRLYLATYPPTPIPEIDEQPNLLPHVNEPKKSTKAMKKDKKTTAEKEREKKTWRALVKEMKPKRRELFGRRREVRFEVEEKMEMYGEDEVDGEG